MSEEPTSVARPDDAETHRVAELAVRTLPRVMGAVASSLREAGWGSPQRIFVLRTLLRAPSTVGDLATRHNVSAPTMSVVVTGLEREGLVRRATNPADRRRVVVTITDAGRELLAGGCAAAADAMAARFRHLTPEEIRSLGTGLEIFQRAYEDEPGLGRGPASEEGE